MNTITESVVTILTAIVGVAILSVIVSRNSQTSEVLSSAGSAFGNILGVAVSPVTGGNSFGGGFSLPNLGGF